MPYFNDSWGVKSNWNSPFSTNQHLPAVQEKVTIKPILLHPGVLTMVQ